MRRSGDIRARAEASLIGGKRRRRGRSQEDDRGLTFDLNEFGVRERNSAEIGLAVFERRSYVRTHRQTHRHLSFLYRDYILGESLLCMKTHIGERVWYCVLGVGATDLCS